MLILKLRDDSAGVSRDYQVNQDFSWQFGIGSRAAIAYPSHHDKGIDDKLFQNLVPGPHFAGNFDGDRLHHAGAGYQ